MYACGCVWEVKKPLVSEERRLPNPTVISPPALICFLSVKQVTRALVLCSFVGHCPYRGRGGLQALMTRVILMSSIPFSIENELAEESENMHSTNVKKKKNSS